MAWKAKEGCCLQAVTALAFTDDGTVLLSAGEDTVACAWLLMDVLDASPEQGSGMHGPPTFQSWLATYFYIYLNFRLLAYLHPCVAKTRAHKLGSCMPGVTLIR